MSGVASPTSGVASNSFLFLWGTIRIIMVSAGWLWVCGWDLIIGVVATPNTGEATPDIGVALPSRGYGKHR